MVIHVSIVGNQTVPDPQKIAEALVPLLVGDQAITTINIETEPVAYVHSEPPAMPTPPATAQGEQTGSTPLPPAA